MSDRRRPLLGPGGVPLTVTISGGSIGGLCAGVVLHGLGADVQIHERVTGPMTSRGAGIVVQDELVQLLRTHGARPLPTTSCRVRRYLEADGGAGSEQVMAQSFTSWEAIYHALRAAFPDDRYHHASSLEWVEQRGDEVILATDAGPRRTDLFLAADGASSATRRRLLPEVSAQYAGYVAWRGTLDEASAPPGLVAFLDDAFTFSEARSGGHMLHYFIPGDRAAVVPGHRRMNWVWYVRVAAEDLPALLTDRDGHPHHTSLPQGRAPGALLADLRARAGREVHPRFAELVAATPEPFVQTITDVIVPQTVFGRAMLLGDAAFVVRPHTAGATAKAAHDARVLGACLGAASSDISGGLRAAQQAQLDYGRTLTRHGIALGERWAPGRSTRS